jgi:hypothetical protein
MYRQLKLNRSFPIFESDRRRLVQHLQCPSRIQVGVLLFGWILWRPHRKPS